MALVKWQPYGMRHVREFDDLFNRFFSGIVPSRRALVRDSGPDAWNIPLDIVQDGDELVVTASLPGASRDEIDVSVDGDVLTIRAESSDYTVATAPLADQSDNGSDESTDVAVSEATNTPDNYLLRERRTGAYYRAVRLPESVDYDNAESTFRDGVLTIRLPKLESKKARKLEISAA